MARADRLERLDRQREESETEYLQALVAALQVTASGKWGLFNHNPDRKVQAALAPTLEHLAGLAAQIDDMRDLLALPPFELHREFLAARGPADPQAVGEPKQARAWLDRLARQ